MELILSEKWTTNGPEDLIKAAKDLSNSDSCDVYNMTNDFIKTIFFSIAIPLTIFLSRCLQERLFLGDLKLSKTLPITSYNNLWRKMGLLTVNSFVFEKTKQQWTL